jgi:hypothetical protein
LVFEALRPSLPADGLLLLDGTTCKAFRAASGTVGSTSAAEALGRSRGGLCSKLHACADGAGRVLRLIASPGHHADLRYASALISGIPARDVALDRGYVSAALRAAFAAEGCTIHTPSKRGMVDPPAALRLARPRREPVLQPRGLSRYRPTARRDPPRASPISPPRSSTYASRSPVTDPRRFRLRTGGGGRGSRCCFGGPGDHGSAPGLVHGLEHGPAAFSASPSK